MNRERHRQIEKLADGVRTSGSLPPELGEVIDAGLRATKPPPSDYARMLHKPERTWQSETGIHSDQGR